MGLEEGLAKKTEITEHLAFLQSKQFLESRQEWALAEEPSSGLVRGETSYFPKQGGVISKRRKHGCAVFGGSRGSHSSPLMDADFPLCQPGPSDELKAPKEITTGEKVPEHMLCDALRVAELSQVLENSNGDEKDSSA